MKDYKRLTKRCGDIVNYAKPLQSNFIGAIYEEQKERDSEIMSRLAELEDKIESGELISKKEVERLQNENAALRERLEKAVDKTIVSEMLAKYFDCPCNFSPLDEEMWAYCRDNCVDDNIECWIRVINKKCAELKGEKK